MEKFSKNKTENKEPPENKDIGPRNIVERWKLRTLLRKIGLEPIPDAEVDALDDPDRRNFLQGLVAGTVVASIGISQGSEAHAEADDNEQLRPKSRKDVERERLVEEANIDLLIQELPFTWQSFAEQVIGHSDHYLNELDSTLEFGSQITRGDELGRTRLAYLRQALSLPNFSRYAEELIKMLLPAKAIVETGLDASRESGLAYGILQFTLASWNAHRPSENANIESLVDQMRATESLLDEMRRELEGTAGEALSFIREQYFDDDEVEFQTKFFVPAILQSFNAGARSVAIIINEFYEKLLLNSKIDKIEAFRLVNMNLGSEDLFQLMIYFAKELKWGVDFGDDAFAYVAKIYSARMVLDTHLTPQQKATLLGETNV